MSDNNSPGQEPQVIIKPVRRGAPALAHAVPVILVMLFGAVYLHWDYVRTWVEPLLSTRTPNTARSTPATAFGGIGLELKSATGGAAVVHAFPNTPAARAGLQEGDVIIAVDGISVAQKSVTDISARLRGPAGSGVAITYTRNGGAPQQLMLTREILQPSVFKTEDGK